MLAATSLTYLSYTVKTEKQRAAAKANGTQSFMILEGPDIDMAIDGNAGPSGKEREGAHAGGGDSGKADVGFTIHVDLRQCVGESEIDQDMREDQNEERSGQGATAEGGPSKTQETTG